MRDRNLIKVLLADDHAIVCEGLRLLFERLPDIELVYEAKDGREAVENVRKLLPDIVVMDITMPNLNGVEATRQIVSEFPQVKVIAFSIHSNRRFVSDMFEAGAVGYVLKECLFEELVQAIRAVREGGNFLSPQITDIVIKDYVKRLVKVADSQLSSLKSREREIFQLIAEGKSTRDIAFELRVSTKTVDANQRKIMEKLNAHTVVDLVKIAINENLISIDLDKAEQAQPIVN